ncbi:MAG: cupin domain-containing protein [Bradymonadaceae bacterium]
MKRVPIILSLIFLWTACAAAPPTVELEPVSAEQEALEPIEPIVQSIDDVKPRVSPTGETTVLWLASGEKAYLGKIALAPGAVVPLHRHESEEYLYIVEGGGVMTIEGKEYELAPGTVVLVPTGFEHGYVNGPAPTKALQVFAAPDGAARFLEWAESDEPPVVDDDPVLE